MKLSLALLVLVSSASAQSTAVRIDFGDAGNHTGVSAGVTWNDVDANTSTASLALLDVAGNATGMEFAFSPGLVLGSSNTAGTTSPTPGSALASLGWPVSALRDTLYGSSGNLSAEFSLTGLEPSATYDITIVASRVGVADVRTTEYEALGARTTSVVINASNNTTNFVRLRGISTDASGTVTITIRPHTTNNNPSSYYYVNAIGIDGYSAGTQAPLVGLSTNLHHVSRVLGKGPIVQYLSLYTNDGTSPNATLHVVDDATQAAPTWLTVPASTNPGAFSLTFDPTMPTVGTHTATLTATSPGYAQAQATLSFAVRPPGGLNLLFYGNSYSLANGGMPSLLAALAVDAGQLEPNDVARLQGGKNLAFHLNDPAQSGAITQALPPGEEWDFVIMQGHSTEATAGLGDPDAFRANALAIVTNVRAHSPNARAVLFQTWARGRGHSVYQGSTPTFARPYDMHLEIEQNYGLAVADINAAFGPGVATRAACGETVALRNFAPQLYNPDLAHPEPTITVMTTATIYTAIYEDDACDIVPDFAGSSALAQRLSAFGVNADAWHQLAGYSARVASPVQRHLPGSGEDLLLRTSTDGLLSACPKKPLPSGNTLTIAINSPASNYATPLAMLYFDLAPTGSLPGPWSLHPEVQLSPMSARVLVILPGLGEGVSFGFPVSISAVGWSVLLQGISFGPSAKTGNPDFTTTDAHEFYLR